MTLVISVRTTRTPLSSVNIWVSDVLSISGFLGRADSFQLFCILYFESYFRSRSPFGISSFDFLGTVMLGENGIECWLCIVILHHYELLFGLPCREVMIYENVASNCAISCANQPRGPWSVLNPSPSSLYIASSSVPPTSRSLQSNLLLNNRCAKCSFTLPEVVYIFIWMRSFVPGIFFPFWHNCTFGAGKMRKAEENWWRASAAREANNMLCGAKCNGREL
jgi:hypothetical protein